MNNRIERTDHKFDETIINSVLPSIGIAFLALYNDCADSKITLSDAEKEVLHDVYLKKATSVKAIIDTYIKAQESLFISNQ